MMHRLGRDVAAAQHLRQANRVAPASPAVQAALAWLLATSHDAAVRDRNEALRLANHCAEPTDCRRPAFLQAIGAAHAELGQFDEPVRRQQQAIEKSLEELCKTGR